MFDFNDFVGLLKKDRSVRRFDHSKIIEYKHLKELVALTKYCASGRNAQPLKYRIVNDEFEAAKVYETLKWAGYYSDWDGPEPSQRPVAYIVQCLDKSITENLLCDDGLQLQAITLGATIKGFSGCIIKSFNSVALKQILNLPDNLQPLYVYALGYGVENVKLVDIRNDNFIYYRDANETQCVPKRSIEELIVK